MNSSMASTTHTQHAAGCADRRHGPSETCTIRFALDPQPHGSGSDEIEAVAFVTANGALEDDGVVGGPIHLVRHGASIQTISFTPDRARQVVGVLTEILRTYDAGDPPCTAMEHVS